MTVKARSGKEREFHLVLQGFQSSPGLIEQLQENPGCQNYRFRSESMNEPCYVIESEWQSWEEMEAHFKSHIFSIFLGAIRVLCDLPEVEITDGQRTVGMEAIQEALGNV